MGKVIKKKVMNIIVCFVIGIMFSNIFIMTVEGRIIDYSGGEEVTYASSIGDGQWREAYVGLKISLIKYHRGGQVYNIEDSKIILNKDICTDQKYGDTKFYYTNVPKFQQASKSYEKCQTLYNGARYDSGAATAYKNYCNSENEFYNAWYSVCETSRYGKNYEVNSSRLPDSWNNGQLDLHNYLTKDGFSNLSYLVYTYFDMPVDERYYYIVIEPMVLIVNYFGTVYELSNSFLYHSSTNSIVSGEQNFYDNYNNYVFSGLFSHTLVLEESILKYNESGVGTTGNLEIWKSSVGGKGIGIFKLKNIPECPDNICSDDPECPGGDCGDDPECPGGDCGDDSCPNGDCEDINKEYPGFLVIHKWDADRRAPITNISPNLSAIFEVYTNNSCTGNYVKRVKTGTAGVIAVELEPNREYFVKEVQPPQGYEIVTDEENCKAAYVSERSGTSVYFYNTSSCISDFTSIDKTNMAERISIYQKYYARGYNYNKLLNKSVTKPVEACSYDDPEEVYLDIGCMSALIPPVGNFGSNDLSSYSFTMGSGEDTLYCVNQFSLRTNFNLLTDNYSVNLSSYPISIKNRYYRTTTSSSSSFASGQMIINGKASDIISIGKLETICYGRTSATSSNSVSYIENLEKIELDGKELTTTIDQATNWVVSEAGSGFYKHVLTSTAQYRLNPVYVENGTGKKSDSNCPNCKLLGYGFASNLNQSSGRYYFNYNFNFGSTLGVLESEIPYDYSNLCSYEIYNELIEEPPGDDDPPTNTNLNIEFRVIDTQNAFSGINGQGRKTGFNWSTYLIDTRFAAKVSVNGTDAYNIYLEAFNGNVPYYYYMGYYNDGIFDIKDADYIQYMKSKDINNSGSSNFYCVGTDKSSDISCNYFAEYVLEKTNNSYNKKGTGAEYKIVLTPTTIKKIRKYNETHDYDDYTLECVNGENCKSTFLEDTTIWNNNNLTINSELINNSL